MRIMSCSHGIHTHFQHQFDIIFFLGFSGCISVPFSILMITHSMNFIFFSVQIRLPVFDLKYPNSELLILTVKDLSVSIQNGYIHSV